MSAGTHGGHAASTAPDAHHGAHHGEGAPHGSLNGYLIGFVLSVILTAIPFWLVMAHVLPTANATILSVMGLAAVQIVVHMVYFLHLNTKSEAGWTMLALIFTIVVLVISISGSLWVMYHLNINMAPMSTQDARNIP